MPETQYIQIKKEDCWQEKTGGTPCFHTLKSKGVSCGLSCPKKLAEELSSDAAMRMLHDGICLMDLAYPGTEAIFQVASDHGGNFILTPEGVLGLEE